MLGGDVDGILGQKKPVGGTGVAAKTSSWSGITCRVGGAADGGVRRYVRGARGPRGEIEDDGRRCFATENGCVRFTKK